MTTLADALRGGSRYIKWEEQRVGVAVSGEIVDVAFRHAKKYMKDELDYWDDGVPKMQAVITIKTDARDSADDDGRRAISVNIWSGQRRALDAACKAAGADAPQPGQTFTVTWVGGVGVAGDPRVFEYTLTGKASPTGLAAALSNPEPVGAFAASEIANAKLAQDGLTAEQEAALAGLTPQQRAALLGK